MHADPKSAKNTVKQSVSFALLGSALLKAKHKMLVKLTPDYQMYMFAPKLLFHKASKM
jgi:hypothetical protein